MTTSSTLSFAARRAFVVAMLSMGLSMCLPTSLAEAGNGACPDGGLVEPEACGEDNNGGCLAAPPAGVSAHCGQVWCGQGYADGGVRDTDWYVLNIEDSDGDGTEVVTASLMSEFNGLCFIVSGIADCAPIVEGIGCSENGVALQDATAVVPAPALYAVFVGAGNCDGSGVFDGFPCGATNDYSVSIDCDESSGFCPADLDGDLNVGVLDLIALVLAWGPCPDDPKPCPADLDGDGDVGVLDMIALVLAWGSCIGGG